MSLKAVGKRFAGAADPAVTDVSLSVADGEFFVLLGPSGCGKSTTLRMIAGLETISEGTLRIDGRSMNDVPARDRDIAMVFQSYALYPHMTVYDNMAFGLRRRSLPKPEQERRIRAAAAMLELSPLLARKPHALSGGQRQRVAVGRAIVREPAVFLFDEPLSNLDAALRTSTRAELTQLHRRLGATMIYVTHDQVEAMTMGNRLCIMDRGRVAQVGRPLEVYDRPATVFVAAFLGSPPMNLMLAECAHDGIHVAGTVLPGAGPPGPVTLGIRPEALVIHPEGILAGTVAAVEPLGAETIVAARLPGIATPLLVRAGRGAPASLDQTIRLAVLPGALHLFDSATGQRLED